MDNIILGGGPAGLAAGFYAKQKGLTFTILEGSERVGGNTVTFQRKEFRFDSGAHRFHNKDLEITRDLADLLGEDLRKIHVPSQVYHQNRLIDFPFSPVNLLKNIGFRAFCTSACQVLKRKLAGQNGCPYHFEQFAINTYGRELANRFLLNYSTKLWGVPCDRLSPAVSGKRLKGLSLKSVILEFLFGDKAKTEHLEGATFYYPSQGFGLIAEKFEEYCGSQNVRTQSRITKVIHDPQSKTITAVEINGKEIITTPRVINTLPVSLFLKMMSPLPPEEILDVANALRFRNMILVFIALDTPAITPNATIYFPDSEYIFTRICEPRNRCPLMSPEGKTSLVVEIPCQPSDPIWTKNHGSVIQELVIDPVAKIFNLSHDAIIDQSIIKLHNAYPVLEVGIEEKIASINNYLSAYSNLYKTGRNGIFEYIHVHDLMRMAKNMISEMHE